jgi:hypothetical protein
MARYRTFRDFYSFYLTQHRDPVCRLLHVVGVLASAATLAVGLASQVWLVAALAPLVGYAFGWTGHFVFEGNRPASFRQPLLSFLGDLAMARDVLTGRIALRPARDGVRGGERS